MKMDDFEVSDVSSESEQESLLSDVCDNSVINCLFVSGLTPFLTQFWSYHGGQLNIWIPL